MEFVDASSQGDTELLPGDRVELLDNPSDTSSQDQPTLTEKTLLITKVSVSAMPLSSSLSRWEKSVFEFEKKAAKKLCTIPPAPVVPSPVSSRTRISLKRAASFSFEDEVRTVLQSEDRMSVSLRKALNKRKQHREAPATKRGKQESVGSL